MDRSCGRCSRFVLSSLLALLGCASRLAALPPETVAPLRLFQEAPGFNPERIYTEVLPTDHVDVFTGALVVSQRLWTAPQLGQLSVSLTLHHSSRSGDTRMWGGEDWHLVQPGDPPVFRSMPPHDVNRFRESWVGPGFELSLGRIALAPVTQAQFHWHYLDETGALHRLLPVETAPPATPKAAPIDPDDDGCPPTCEPPPPPQPQTYMTGDGT